MCYPFGHHIRFCTVITSFLPYYTFKLKFTNEKSLVVRHKLILFLGGAEIYGVVYTVRSCRSYNEGFYLVLYCLPLQLLLCHCDVTISQIPGNGENNVPVLRQSTRSVTHLLCCWNRCEFLGKLFAISKFRTNISFVWNKSLKRDTTYISIRVNTNPHSTLPILPYVVPALLTYLLTCLILGTEFFLRI